MSTDFPLVDVVRVRAMPAHRLWVRFSDGSEAIRDLASMVAGGGEMVAPLKDPEYFARVFVEMGAPTWPNGFDLVPINLYMELQEAGEIHRSFTA